MNIVLSPLTNTEMENKNIICTSIQNLVPQILG